MIFLVGVFWQALRQKMRKGRDRAAKESPRASREHKCTLRWGHRVNATDFQSYDRSWSAQPPQHFRIKGRLGRGTFGQVYRAVDGSGRPVAVKALDRHAHLLDPFMRTLLRRAIQNHCRLNHPNIVRLHGVLEAGKHIMLVQELVESGTLFQYAYSKQIFEFEARNLVRDLLRALAHIHSKGIVHADIKSENILIANCQGRRTVKVADFGCSLDLAGSKRNEWRGRGGFQGQVGETDEMGTRPFLAPEIWDHQPCGVKVDMWALGVLTYELVYGCLC